MRRRLLSRTRREAYSLCNFHNSHACEVVGNDILSHQRGLRSIDCIKGLDTSLADEFTTQRLRIRELREWSSICVRFLSTLYYYYSSPFVSTANRIYRKPSGGSRSTRHLDGYLLTL